MKKEVKEELSTELVGEIDAAVDASMPEVEPQEIETDLPSVEVPADEDLKGDDESPDENKGKGDVVKTDEGEDPPEETVTDDHLERAVRAGMTMTDARSIKSAEALERMCSLLEARKEDGDGGNEKPATEEEEDPLDGIPDLDPEEYDEEIVNGFKAMKEIIRGQSKVIGELKSGDKMSWFDSKVSGLGVETNTAQNAAVKKKFDVLSAGYKAAGDDVTQDDIFKEASEMVLGKEMAELAEIAKTKQLKKRSAQHSNRPVGKSVKPKGDPLEDVAAEIDAKYFR